MASINFERWNGVPKDLILKVWWYRGMGEIVKASGRATCRACGERIAKGAPALAFYYNFNNDNPFTDTKVYIHAAPCRE